MSVHPLQAAFTSSNQPRGPVVPVTVFMEVSGYPDAATAMQALKHAQAELDKAKARKSLLALARVQLFADPKDWLRREKWEKLNDYDAAGWHLSECYEELERVERRMGLFHPKNRALLSGWVESAVGILDNLDGNPDEEEEPLEDAFVVHDPAFAMMDGDGRDVAWPEWHTRGRHKVSGHGAEMDAPMAHEDDEDDDPAEDDDPDTGIEDGLFDPEFDNEPDEQAYPDYGIDQTSGALPPDVRAEYAMMKPHLQRARRRLKFTDD